MENNNQPQDKPQLKTITLREDSQLNQKIIDELEELLKITTPRSLLKSSNYVYFEYLRNTRPILFPSFFKQMNKDYYFLHKFLGVCCEGFVKKK